MDILTGIYERGMYVEAVSYTHLITCYIKETDIRNVKKGTPVYIDGKEYEIAEISEIPVKLKEEQLESAAFAVDESVYTATIHTGLADGIYKVELVTNRVSPMSFVIN